MQSFPESYQLPFPALEFSLGVVEKATNNFAREISEFSVDHGKAYHGNISTENYSGEVFVIVFNKVQHYEKLISKNKIKVLSDQYHHVNIVSLVGICCEEDTMILVYEFMPNGSLYDRLYYKQKYEPHLTVEQRLEICVGVAKGLCYLHCTSSSVVHGKMKTNNILLDASLVPKISGFRSGEDGYYSSGSYTPPECHEPGYKLSQKADVHAFGVVLLEVLCERKPWDKLLVLALPFIMNGELPKATPEHVKKNLTPACAWQCEKLIMNCLEFQPHNRPSMNQVVQDLELALQLQRNKQINFVEQSSGVNNKCQSFSLVDIRMAINELSDPLGEGGYGKVYPGKISSNGKSVDVAIKILSPKGFPTFIIEKQLLSACDHVNIISLVGYCDENDNRILVYEFMPNGSLYDYIYKTKPKDNTPKLTVEQRLEICLGVAKGLTYLHSRNDYNIIHSDLKTDNILLDANFVPKISDFGLSRIRDVGPYTSSLITNSIQGTEGYIAPECYEPNYKLSRKADVYAFGIVLLEVLCEKRGWERLVIWALPFVAKGELPKFTPEYVLKNISLECLRACTNLIRDCLETDPSNRPSMSKVVANLDSALTLQKMNVEGNDQKNKSWANTQQRFSFSDIERATEKFAQLNLLGNPKSKFREVRHDRKVYRGKISIDVAVKRMPTKVGPSMDRQSYDLDSEAFFKNEINLLSACHHANIISLAGYCVERDEKILIFEFMENGSLYDHIHTEQDGAIPLTVEERLDICLGVAKGVSYLHSSNIIHGYLNSKNILLDRNYVAKITGFEFSSKFAGAQSTCQNIVRRAYIGMAYEYFGPEYKGPFFKLSQKSDIYAFGVVFLEVLCERSARNNLITLALPFIMRGELAEFTPEHVRTNISRKCAQACENLLRDCLGSDPDKRPSMNQIVEKLELALKLQKELAN